MTWRAIMVSTGEVVAESDNFRQLSNTVRDLVPSTTACPMPYYFTAIKSGDARRLEKWPRTGFQFNPGIA